MRNFRPRATVIISFLSVVLPAGTEAQAPLPKPVWETLIRRPLPADALPQISVADLPLGPAPAVPRPGGPGHTHQVPVFAYILQGEIENQVEPDPPQVYKAGGFFDEIPGHIHRFMRNLSQTEPAKVIVFQAGEAGTPPVPLKILLQEPLLSTMNQELTLSRLTLPPGTGSEVPPHTGPGIICVLDGTIEISQTTGQPRVYRAGDLFAEPADSTGLTVRNSSDKEPAKLLFYDVSENRDRTPAP